MDWIVFLESGLRGKEFESATKLGFKVILFTQNTITIDPVNLKFVDTIIHFEKLNLDQIVSKLKELKQPIRLCLSTSDYWMRLAAEVSELLDLPTVPSHVINICVNKELTRKWLAQHHFRQPKSIKCNRLQDAIDFYLAVQSKIVLKPMIGTMSAAVYIADNIHDIRDAYRKVKSFLTFTQMIVEDNAIIAEEYIEGELISAELFRTPEQDYFLGLTDRYQIPEIEAVEMGFVFPCQHKCASELMLESFRALDAIGFKSGPCHIEFIVSEKGAVILEINPRIGGVPSLMMNLAFDIDFLEVWLKLCLGEVCSLPKFPKRIVACREIASPITGRLLGISNWDAFKVGEHGLIYKELFTEKIGKQVRYPTSNMDLIGRIMTTADDEAEARLKCSETLEKLKLEIEVKPLYGG